VPYSRNWVLGVPVDDAQEGDVLQFVRDRVSTREPATIVTVNAEYVVRAVDDPSFMDVVRGADLATADGAGVLWALRRQGVRLPRRVGGSDLIWSISRQAAGLGHRVFLLGAAPGVSARAADVLRSTYPTLLVAGTHAGSPDENEREAIVDLIRRSRADIVFVAFGSPKQDVWIAANQQATGASVAMGVGGSIDYVAGVARRAPRWMQDSGLDWLWRLVRQPWRWKRMLSLPRFVWLVLRDPARTEKGPHR
jgi:N-acetylglucosaminyldiphosphoundecaprenol N-acetyl-beta-D-mannosaminyltransferase